MIPRQSLWLPSPEGFSLKGDEVHVWRAYLDQEASFIKALSDVLTPDELERARRFHFQKDRDHFIVARGALRHILSRYLKTAPDRIRFSYNQYGKPALSEEGSDGWLSFNISHSHALALYGVTRGRNIGLDVEWMREDFASQEIAASFFSPREVASLRALPAEQQTLAFFNCWTRKEAYIKARGEGLSCPLDKFTVSLAPGEAASLLSAEGGPQETSRWSLVELSPGAGYVAALAVEGKASPLHCWQWDG
jgi:4'-phosphopantetheinyl transferase